MTEHREELRVTTGGGDVWIGCVCGWVSPPLHGETIADAAFFLHCMDEDELLAHHHVR